MSRKAETSFVGGSSITARASIPIGSKGRTRIRSTSTLPTASPLSPIWASTESSSTASTPLPERSRQIIRPQPMFRRAQGRGTLRFIPTAVLPTSSTKWAIQSRLSDSNAEHGGLQPIQTVSTLPKDFKGTSHTAEVVVHPSGKFVYGSNRGHDSLAIFWPTLDGQTDALEGYV